MAKRITLDFLKTEAASGLILAAAAALGVLLANSAWSHAYFGFIGAPFTVQLGGFAETHSVLDWIKEGLMAIFFFVVGLEIKYEVRRGELSNPRRLALPIVAALGGVVAPAAIYLMFAGSGSAAAGWPTPTATDIAFALAALAMVGRRLPPTLRIFLLTLAIVDDIAAVAMIGVLFTDDLRLAPVGGALAALGLMALLGRWRKAPYLFYAVGFALVWAFTLKSGISTSLAGVAAAMTIPLEPRKPHKPGVLEDFMESLHPYVAFLILPLFAFSAAGFSLGELRLADVFGPVALGVALGLFLGKQIGVFGAAALMIVLKLARRPTGAKWIELYGVSLLCGIGFTMSLFIGELAFPGADAAAQTQVRVGVIAGSLLSASAGMAVLAWSQARRGPQLSPERP
ncbi:Na+/H+ antiporter NhaA [Phenylobacterium sp.]|jgi:NhaA family Na+:H+ antiporter|uniref:Na+/H+ antiporter NhaA n=1 Tax=Phenylobacterium sp. TaxID=1871053 RepID=UPI002F931A84